MIDDKDLKEWIERGTKEGAGYVLIFKDLTDGQTWPLYLSADANVTLVTKCFISESKMKLLGTVRL